MSVADVSPIVWAAQGITSDAGQRTAPSAQQIYPLTVYVFSQNVSGLAPGAYRYVPQGHPLEVIGLGDMSQQFRTPAPVGFVIVIDLDKKPGTRPAANGTGPGSTAPVATPGVLPAVSPGVSVSAAAPAPAGSSGMTEETIHSWYYAEAGHAAQNMYLQAERLDLGMVTPARFDAAKLQSLLHLEGNMTPFYYIPAGHPA